MLARWITWNETVDDYVGSMFCYFDSKLKVGFKTLCQLKVWVYSGFTLSIVRVRVLG